MGWQPGGGSGTGGQPARGLSSPPVPRTCRLPGFARGGQWTCRRPCAAGGGRAGVALPGRGAG